MNANIFNPVVGMTVPWYIHALLFWQPTRWTHEEPIKGFVTTWSIGYKKLFGTIYIVREGR